MTQTASGPSRFSFGRFSLPDAFYNALSVLMQVFIGVLLVAFAGIVALMTAFVGVLLAAAALVMRFAGGRRMRPAPATGESEPLTLDARRTPRGWTVE